MIKSVFILGNHIQALGLVRQIKQMGVDTILFTDTRFSIARFSNTVKQSYRYRDEVDLLNTIIHFNKNPKSILLFPTNDYMVEFLKKKYTLLSRLFYMGIPEPETVDVFANKCNTYSFATINNIPIPESYFPGTLLEIEEIADSIKYPVIIKPAIMHTFHKKFGKKALKCNNKTELISGAAIFGENLPIDQLIIQEFLDGGAKSLYSYGTFAVNGKAIVSVMANRTRQNPMTFGNSTTYAVTCNIPEVKEQAEKILELTNYFGLAEIEFMFDEKTGQYKFLEVNTRAWKWHSISDGLGFSFIGKMISYFNDNDTYVINNFSKITGWIERLTDSTVVIKELFRGNNLFKEVLQSYKIPRVYAVWSPRDMLPFFIYLVFSPVLYFKRH